MLISAAARLRVALSTGFGIRFAPWSLDRLLESLSSHPRNVGREHAGPALCEETRHELQRRRFRKQALRARETPYYAALFERLELDAGRLDNDDLERIPLTRKEALRQGQDAFVRRTASPCFRATTTGTTGCKTSISFSAAEMRTYIALSAVSFLASGEIGSSDIVQVSTSSRAALGNTCFAGACARIGALVTLTGLVEPEQALAQLMERRDITGKKCRVSVLSTYPSYLGELVEEGLRRGYRPADFGLEWIVLGGELASEGLKLRSQHLFGPVRFDETYAMTETWPMGGQRCEEGHLHFEPSTGLVEVVNPETGAPALPGEAGTIVATPFPPYRDTTLLLRYDTEDVVRPIAGPLTCTLRTMPATSSLLGKLRLSARHEQGWTYPRDVLEALEALEDVPLPARYGFRAVPRGVAVDVVARAVDAAVRGRVQSALEERNVPVVELTLVDHPSQLQRGVPLRSDLRELSFSMPGAADRDSTSGHLVRVS